MRLNSSGGSGCPCIALIPRRAPPRPPVGQRSTLVWTSRFVGGAHACDAPAPVRFYSLVMRILVVEDERKVASFLRQGLQEEGHAVETAADGAAALDMLLEGPGYDLVVLDVMLPKRDGFEVLKTLRQRRVQTPVLCLTARDAVSD